MPDITTLGEAIITLEATIIRADGTTEDVGVIASTEPLSDEGSEM